VAKRDSGVVFIVDDDASLRRSLRNLLKSAGFEVAACASAEAFLASGDRDSAACLVVDLRMPGMSGLDLLSHLASTGSPIPTIILTAHGDDAARRRSMRAGAFAFFEKPFKSAALVDAVRKAVSTLARGERDQGSTTREEVVTSIEPLRAGHPSASDRRVQFAGGTLGRDCHICAFFNSADEEHRVLRSFIKDGIDAGEKSCHFVDPQLRVDYLKRLGEAGIDVERTMASGQLDVRPWEETYLRGDRFEQDAMLHLIEEVIKSGAADGYPLTRILAHMEWAVSDKQGVDDLVEYETRVNYVLSKYFAPVICTYDLSKFSATVVMDILRTHPVVIISGVLQENPFFVPPDQLLLELRERRSARKHAATAS